MDRRFRLNEVVSIHARGYPNHGIARVWYHNKNTHTVYVLVRTGTFSWRVKSYDELSVEPVNDYVIWGMSMPFSIK